jgi:hypothetical protein
VNRSTTLLLFAIVAVGFGTAVMLARLTPASQERTFWRSVLDAAFARDRTAAATEDEDRPPIVIRSGSIHFDGGDVLNPAPAWRGWTLVSNTAGTSVWKPDHPAGAAVRAFEVMAFNAIATPTCAPAPFVADRIDLVYAGSARPQTASIHTAADKNHKSEPVIETTLTLTAVSGNGTAPDSLAYTADGVLTGFNASSQGHCVAACTFNALGAASLRVAPIR